MQKLSMHTGEANASSESERGKSAITFSTGKDMRTRNVKGVHGRGGEMSVRDRMRRDENDEMRVRSIKLIVMIDES